VQEFPDAQIRFHIADLSSQRQVRETAEAARTWAREDAEGKLDVVINNAAVVSSRYTTTEDGYELTFAVNHLAPFLLSHELLPVLAAAPSPRVVTVSSGSHRRARIHWRDVMLRRGYGILRAYRQSKLANVMFAAEWNRRWAQGAYLRAYAADPGLVNTEIGLKGTRGMARWLWDRHRVQGASAEVGARTVVFLATDSGVERASEVYWRDCRPARPDPYALRVEEAERLWAISEKLCGVEPRDPLTVP
jgi:NAD(P)-dependent dehydrogenase (short-subunit alcohol dehydrogenase family)